MDRSLLGGTLPEEPTDPEVVIKLLEEVVAPATMAMAGPRFFGWVIGGSYPVALVADWMTSAWDQKTVLIPSQEPAHVGMGQRPRTRPCIG